MNNGIMRFCVSLYTDLILQIEILYQEDDSLSVTIDGKLLSGENFFLGPPEDEPTGPM